ncbi:hypothetical protein B0T26DRAFT_767282 [Lasiosphaeria miniovina]|uniref:Zn(2)-C6 fungal-type domain-containing protein n=1 Tax=Lasiosphaeria miniovina TaxID=1954250 RepID=A0AA40E8P2_9PEZI|nr:uncharacterized protein B0T26DRAFT_767282 [Lasiosphaeria miniovina]KAK0728106.1 hypothetical protein B0T26DRAFT_767282 [Lasiosphaeria miniovina]
MVEPITPSSSNGNPGASGGDGEMQAPARKRRKIRKGTQSCWECKRRKIRCTFVAAPAESVCDGCKSRRLKCVSQAFDDEATTTAAAEAAAAGGGTTTTRTAFGKDIGTRLGRIETAVHDIAKRTDAVLPSRLGAEEEPRGGGNIDAANPPTPSGVRGVLFRVGGGQAKDRHDELCRTLVAAWPKPDELEVVLGFPVSTSVLFHGVICTPYANFLSKDMPTPRDMLRLPRSGSHPVLVARALLLLAIFMQGIPRFAREDLGAGLGDTALGSAGYGKTISRLAETANRLVTSNDDLVGSLEGVETIMFESMYHNNAGNLRRAWVTHRRAMVIAQLMGLHRAAAAANAAGSSNNTLMAGRLVVHDSETLDRIDPEHMWYRLVISDRYLSLMLGLPQASLDSPYGSLKALEGCIPMERLERMESIAGGLILQRNSGPNIHDLAATREIDRLLQEAAAQMPAQWWLTPNVSDIIGKGNEENFGETLRIMNQFTHYHLLAQLHLPYLLLQTAPGDQKYDYSKMTAVMASREILSRFVAFRGSNAVTAYCRGIDFLAFIASTILGLAHIDARRQQRQWVSGGSIIGCTASVPHFLAHQRLSDRGLLERTLQGMEKMARGGKDVMAVNIANILQHLLAIEAAAASGVSYSASVSSEGTGEPGEPESEYGGGGEAAEADSALRIRIPYFGTITIENRGGGGGGDGALRSMIEIDQQGLSSSRPVTEARNHSVKRRKQEEGPREPSSSSQAELAGYQISRQSTNSEWQSVPLPSHLDHLLSAAGEPDSASAALDSQGFFADWEPAYGVDMAETSLLFVPGLTADAEDWALQGVDMALFDNLIRGAAEPTSG